MRLAITSMVFVGGMTAAFFVGRSSVDQTVVQQAPPPVVRSKVMMPKPVEERAPERTDPVEQPETLDALFSSIDSANYPAMIQQASAISDAMERDAHLRLLVLEWSKTDPLSALNFAAGQSSSSLLEIALRELGKQQPDVALSWLEQNVTDPSRRRNLSVSVYQSMAKVDPAGAVQRVEQMAAGNDRDELLAAVVDEWARQDIHAVFGWLETAELNPQLHNIYSYAMGQYIQSEPQQAATLISNMQACDMKTEFASRTARQLATDDVAGALSWAINLDEVAQRQALMNVVDVWAGGPDAAAALDYIQANPDYQDYSALLSTAVTSLSYSDPDQLAESMQTMSQGDQMIAAERLAIALSSTDVAKCDAWLDSMEQGPVKDAALKNSLDGYRHSNVSRAFDLAEMISDQSDRPQQMQQVIETWIQVDQEKAEAALTGTDVLSEEQKNAMLAQIYQTVRPNDYVLP